MKYKALFLDLDGTILDTLDDIKEAVNYSLKYHGFKERTREEIRLALGYGSVHLIHESIAQEVDEKLFQSVYDVYLNYYYNHSAVYTKPYGNIVQILTKFKQIGGKIVLITNKPHKVAVQLMDIFFENLFDEIYGRKDDVKPKPDPESLTLAMTHLKLKPKDILYVGDSVVDIETAKNSSLDYVICSYGFNTKEVLIKAGANPLIDKVEDLEGYLF